MRQASGGFTLVEALIALLVLSLGLLGVAAMQLKAMQSAHVAYQRSLATVIAADANERLWAALASTGGSCPDAPSVQTAWKSHWSTALPGIETSTLGKQSTCEFLITVAWSDDRLGEENRTSLSYMARLPEEAAP